MISPIDRVRGEGNCGRVTDRGEEACECVRKYRPDFAADRILTSAARLRTETSYKAGAARRVSTTSQSRSQTTVQVNDELVQRQITLLSGETCQTACVPSFAPAHQACLKAGSRRRKTTRARQESAEVVVLRIARQRSQEGPNDEEGGALDHLGASWSRPGLTAPAPIQQPALSLISEWPTGATVAPVQQRACFPDPTRETDSNPSSNRRMRTRMYGGVGAGRGNPSG